MSIIMHNGKSVTTVVVAINPPPPSHTRKADTIFIVIVSALFCRSRLSERKSWLGGTRSQDVYC